MKWYFFIGKSETSADDDQGKMERLACGLTGVNNNVNSII
jgi:hypothetical protein